MRATVTDIMSHSQEYGPSSRYNYEGEYLIRRKVVRSFGVAVIAPYDTYMKRILNVIE